MGQEEKEISDYFLNFNGFVSPSIVLFIGFNEKWINETLAKKISDFISSVFFFDCLDKFFPSSFLKKKINLVKKIPILKTSLCNSGVENWPGLSFNGFVG